MDVPLGASISATPRSLLFRACLFVDPGVVWGCLSNVIDLVHPTLFLALHTSLPYPDPLPFRNPPRAGPRRSVAKVSLTSAEAAEPTATATAA